MTPEEIDGDEGECLMRIYKLRATYDKCTAFTAARQRTVPEIESANHAEQRSQGSYDGSQEQGGVEIKPSQLKCGLKDNLIQATCDRVGRGEEHERCGAKAWY